MTNDTDTSKPGLARHPAPYSPVILDAIGEVLAPRIQKGDRVYDPFAGIGRIFQLEERFPGVLVYGTEIEKEWVTEHPRHMHMDAFAFMGLASCENLFDYVVTSPTYGNRMADHHEAKDSSRRITYRHYLGRALHPNNSGKMQWGKKYRDFHQHAWEAVWDVVRPGGWFVLNVSDHYRQWELQPVSNWHETTCMELGFKLHDAHQIVTPRMQFGENRSRRAEYEWVLVFEKPKGASPAEWQGGEQ